MAGGFELSFALAPPRAIGQYRGLFGMGMSALEFLGPAVVTPLCPGWSRPAGSPSSASWCHPWPRLAERRATLVSARVADQRP
ncbi:hypothetical protein ACBI99_18935 [Nonomuraea sp. ATR24]|uniref:hypothetical protein n=1 Tax=Nonomuraea sp. ATR24 TaxID=1676744 RepID=UPI0035C10C74